MPSAKVAPKPVTITDVELKALLLKLAREVDAENNSTDTTINKMVDDIMATVKTA